MTDKKIIFFDIDRTLYDPQKKEIPSSTIDALKKLNDDPKIEIAIATGRAFYMLHIIDEIKPYINIFILINGQIIIKDHKTIYKNPLKKAAIKQIVAVLEKNNMKYGFLGEHKETLNIVDEKSKKAFDLVSMNLPKTDPDFYKNNDVFQMWAFCDRTQHKKFKKTFNDLQVVSWIGNGFDILSPKTNKKEGIKKILELENIPLNNAYCIGDGDNDVEMLDYIPNSIAMKNGSKKAKKHAKFITDTIQNEGVVKGLEKFGLLK
ncbi:MAG: Cof-type HAD-IIB family hydrolase [Candidatus Izimaplasma sp.]|nr:Cof-type HAD-IIB family hydrolase [Candidatus Izimaplasma bacterium]